MSDPLSILASVVGLATTSAKISSIAKQLYSSGKDAPASISCISQEMDQLHLIFGQVQMLLEGHVRKRINRSRLSMLPLHHLMTILSGCVLAYSSLDKKLSEVSSAVTHTRSAGLGARMQWAIWKEAEAEVILVELERHKSSLHMMLTIIQCNSMDEASQQLASLHELVKKISGKISESHSDVAAQLRDHHGTFGSALGTNHDGASSVSICYTIHQSTECSLPASLPSPFSCLNETDDASSTRTTSSSLSIRSVRSRIPLWGEELKNSRPYKRLWYRGIDLSSSSVFSKDSSATKGDTWSLLSNMSLGDLSISQISVLELPISLLDLYDPIPYQQLSMDKQVRWRNWSSRGRLHRAIREGNILTFRTLLSLGADPEETNEGSPLLIHAANSRVPDKLQVEFCRLLLDRGVQVDTKDSSRRTPLLVHCTKPGNYSTCQLLLDRGAAVDATDASGRTPLSYCAELGNYYICKLLLDRGAAIDAADSTGRTPLSHGTTYRGILQDAFACELLLNRGAAVDATDASGRTPLSYCAELGNYNICKLLLDRGAAVDAADSSGYTPLSYGAEAGSYSACELLLNRGAAVDATDASGRTPLSYCAELGNYSICRLLLDRGTTVDTADDNGRTPLSYSAETRANSVCRLLLNRGAAVDFADAGGHTILSLCARLGNYSICELLLDRGATVDAVDFSGRTPLSYCAELANDSICKLLLDRGAAIDVPDTGGRTPLSYCVEHGNRITCEFLLGGGATVDAADSRGHTPLSYCATSWPQDSAVCNLLLDRGATVDATDFRGRTPLSLCAEVGSHHICQLLLDRGAAVDATDASGRTPLSYCVELSRLEFCEVLLDRGATVDLADSSGRTPLSYCAELGSDSVCELLLDRGAAVDATDASGRTPLSYCAELNRRHICQLLLSRNGNAYLPDVKGYTPLWYARGQGESNSIYQLLWEH